MNKNNKIPEFKKIQEKNNRILELFNFLSIIKPKNKKEINKSGNRKTQNSNKIRLYFRCVYCKHVITLEQKVEKDFIKICPNCGKKGIIKSTKREIPTRLEPKQFIQYKKLIEIEKGLFKPFLQTNLIGIVLIIIGLIYLVIASAFDIKFGLTIILIGIVILGLVPDRKYFFIKIKKIIDKEIVHINKKNSPIIEKLNYIHRQFSISEKISFAIIILIVCLYVITGVNNLEIFLIFVYLGLVIIRELTGNFMPDYLKKRMTIFLIGFLVIFIILLIKQLGIVII